MAEEEEGQSNKNEYCKLPFLISLHLFLTPFIDQYQLEARGQGSTDDVQRLCQSFRVQRNTQDGQIYIWKAKQNIQYSCKTRITCSQKEKKNRQMNKNSGSTFLIQIYKL